MDLWNASSGSPSFVARSHNGSMDVGISILASMRWMTPTMPIRVGEMSSGNCARVM